MTGLAFRTGRRSSSISAPSARMVGLAIQERRDREAARRTQARDQGSFSAPRFEAEAWLRQRGFDERDIPIGVNVALMLRQRLGRGRVTAAMVRERIGAAYGG